MTAHTHCENLYYKGEYNACNLVCIHVYSILAAFTVTLNSG